MTILNPAFADRSMVDLIVSIEADWLIKDEPVEAELTARLEPLGLRWQFAAPGHVEVVPIGDPADVY